jgi:hypothetical protein
VWRRGRPCPLSPVSRPPSSARRAPGRPLSLPPLPFSGFASPASQVRLLFSGPEGRKQTPAAGGGLAGAPGRLGPSSGHYALAAALPARQARSRPSACPRRRPPGALPPLPRAPPARQPLPSAKVGAPCKGSVPRRGGTVRQSVSPLSLLALCLLPPPSHSPSPEAVFLGVLGMETRASRILRTHSLTELHPRPVTIF